MESVGSPSAELRKGPESICLWRFVCVCVFQELTEEGIPFLILFHVKEDTESLEKFQHEVARQLISEKGVFVEFCTCHGCEF